MKSKNDWVELVLLDQFERHSDCMLEKSPQWEIRARGFPTNGMGDLMVRNAKFAVILQSEELILMNIHLLNDYKRWPDWLEPGREKRKEFHAQGYEKFRGQRSMTRDPYLQTLCAISLMENWDADTKAVWIKAIKIPFWMNRANLFWLKRTLLNPKNLRHLERAMMRDFKFRERMQPRRLVWRKKAGFHRDAGNKFRHYIYGRLQNNLGNPGYVKFMHSWMAYCTGAKRVQEAVARVTPHWNYGVLLLCEKPTMYLAKDFIENYQSRGGWEWSREDYRDGKKDLIPPEQKYQPDKQFLNYLWCKFNEKRKA